MKLTTAQWVAVGIASAAVISEIVLVFVNPIAAIFAGAGFALGCATGYLLKKKGIVTE